jgi:hypothetical protein
VFTLAHEGSTFLENILHEMRSVVHFENGILKRIHSYTLQLFFIEAENNHTSLIQMVVQVNLEYKYTNDIIHRKIQVLKLHG